MEDKGIKPCSILEKGSNKWRRAERMTGVWLINCRVVGGLLSLLLFTEGEYRRYFKPLELKFDGSQFKMRKFGVKQILQQ